MNDHAKQAARLRFWKPCKGVPGSQAKQDAIAFRYSFGLPLWHPGDAGYDAIAVMPCGEPLEPPHED